MGDVRRPLLAVGPTGHWSRLAFHCSLAYCSLAYRRRMRRVRRGRGGSRSTTRGARRSARRASRSCTSSIGHRTSYRHRAGIAYRARAHTYTTRADNLGNAIALGDTTRNASRNTIASNNTITWVIQWRASASTAVYIRLTRRAPQSMEYTSLALARLGSPSLLHAVSCGPPALEVNIASFVSFP